MVSVKYSVPNKRKEKTEMTNNEGSIYYPPYLAIRNKDKTKKGVSLMGVLCTNNKPDLIVFGQTDHLITNVLNIHITGISFINYTK